MGVVRLQPSLRGLRISLVLLALIVGLVGCASTDQPSTVKADPRSTDSIVSTPSRAPILDERNTNPAEKTESRATYNDPTPTKNLNEHQDSTDAREPYPVAPPCQDDLHAITRYHGLWNAEAGCHYDHTHNADPSSMDGVFGPVGSLHNGQSISYNHQTPNENTRKHQGYKWDTTQTEICQPVFPDHNCVMQFRIQVHVVGGAVGANTRFHSFWGEFLVCEKAGSHCGIVKTGGWGDFGILEVPYKGEHIPLENDPPGTQSVHRPPYRGHRLHAEAINRANFGSHVAYTWNSASTYGYNQIVEYDFRSADDWGGITPEDPSRLNFVCGSDPCKYNHSELHFYEILLRVPPELDTDLDGFVTYHGYTDTRGQIETHCRESGPDCVPLLFQNVPIGTASFVVPNGHSMIDFPDYDIYFDGVTSGWIQYPN